MIGNICSSHRSAVDVENIHRRSVIPSEGVSARIDVARCIRVVQRCPTIHRHCPADRPLPDIHHPAQEQRARIHNRPPSVIHIPTNQSQVGRTVLSKGQSPRSTVPVPIANGALKGSVHRLIYR